MSSNLIIRSFFWDAHAVMGPAVLVVMEKGAPAVRILAGAACDGAFGHARALMARPCDPGCHMRAGWEHNGRKACKKGYQHFCMQWQSAWLTNPGSWQGRYLLQLTTAECVEDPLTSPSPSVRRGQGQRRKGAAQGRSVNGKTSPQPGSNGRPKDVFMYHRLQSFALPAELWRDFI